MGIDKRLHFHGSKRRTVNVIGNQSAGMPQENGNLCFDYYLNSATTPCRGIWMSFFAPNWAGALSLLFTDDPGGRLPPP
jgi:hypothetical protein